MGGFDRCDDRWGKVRCQLIDQHESAHAARVEGALMTWANPAAGTHSRVIDTDWHADDYFDLD